MTRAQRINAERAFCEAWIETGPERASAGQVLDLAEAAGLPLTGTTLLARQTSLGRWFEGYAGCLVGDGAFRIVKLGRRGGRRLWTCEPSSERQVNEASSHAHFEGKT